MCWTQKLGDENQTGFLCWTGKPGGREMRMVGIGLLSVRDNSNLILQHVGR